MNTDELIALINELSATIRALREELSAMRADNEALRAEFGLPVVEIPETVIPDVTIPEVTPIKPDMSTPDTKFPKVDLADVPVTRMMVQSHLPTSILFSRRVSKTPYIMAENRAPSRLSDPYDSLRPRVKSEMCWIICLDAAPPRWVSRGRFVPRILRSVRL